MEAPAEKQGRLKKSEAVLRFNTEAEFQTFLRGIRRPAPPALPRQVPTETEEQQAVIQWACLHQLEYPELCLLFHVANGEFRHKATARKLQTLGLLPGIPDLILPVARKEAHSLYIEMKALDGTPSSLQVERAIQLVVAGNMVAFCFGWQMARDVLVWYLTE